MEKSDFTTFIEDQIWTGAKTYPDMPHQWLSAKNCKGTTLFYELKKFIEEKGRIEPWGKYNTRVVFTSSHKYWNTGSVINRCEISPYDQRAIEYDSEYITEQDFAENEIISTFIANAFTWNKDSVFNIVDLGAGTGLLLDICPWIEKYWYVGIEPSSSMCGKLLSKHNGVNVVMKTAETAYDSIANKRIHLLTCLFAGQFISLQVLKAYAMLSKRFFIMIAENGHKCRITGHISTVSEYEVRQLFPAEDIFMIGKYICVTNIDK